LIDETLSNEERQRRLMRMSSREHLEFAEEDRGKMETAKREVRS